MVPAPANAVELGQAEQEVLSKVTQSLNQLDGAIGDFVQVGPDGQRAEGRFFIDRPGRLRFEYNPPSSLQIIADGFWVAVQDTRLKTTEKYPLAATPLKLILARNVDLNRDARVVDVFEQPDFVTVTLEAKSADTPGSLSLMFDGSTYALRQWTVTDAQGLDTSVALSNIESNQPMARRLFRIIDNIEVDVNSDR